VNDLLRRRNETTAAALRSPADFVSAVGQRLGYSEWIEIARERINMSADATADQQWIHVVPERAKDGPFGAWIPTDTSRCRW